MQKKSNNKAHTYKKRVANKLASAVKTDDIKLPYMASGLGHDAMMLGRHIPVAMLFVRRKDGISHNPKEWSSLIVIVSTIYVLRDYVECLLDELGVEVFRRIKAFDFS